MAEVIDEAIKWRFTNPEEYAQRVIEIHADPAREASPTRDGRRPRHRVLVVARSATDRARSWGASTSSTTSPPHALALTDARRLAEERAELLEREERRAQEEMALSRAAHAMASALTPADVHEHLLDKAAALVVRLHQERRAGAPARRDAGGSRPPGASPRSRSGAWATGRRRGGAPGDVQPAPLHLQRHARPTTASPPVSSGRRASARSCTCRSCSATRAYGVLSVNATEPARVRRARAEGDRRAHPPRGERTAERPPVRAGAPHRRDPSAGADRRRAAERGRARAGRPLPGRGRLPGGRRLLQRLAVPDGRLALLVGDVSGKGVEAAGVTAMVRHMAEALSQHRGEPGRAGVRSSTTSCAPGWPTAPW